MVNSLPLLDAGPMLRGEAGAREDFAAGLGAACRDVGFFLLTGHGVAPGLIASAYAETARFHALPEAEKERVRVDRHNIGWLPVRGSVLRTSLVNENTKPGVNAAFFVRRQRAADDPDVLADKPLRGLNQWPEGLPGFREAVLAYMDAMRGLCERLLPAYAEALALPAEFFAPFFDPPNLTLRMTHYPAVEAFTENEHSFDPHTDLGFITLLAPNPVAGLAVQLPEGGWLEVPEVPGAFVVNSGDMLARWSNGRFRSTPHRVLNAGMRDRYAIPFFFDPSPDAVIECLPGCAGPGDPPPPEPILFDDYLQWFSRRNYLHQEEK